MKKYKKNLGFTLIEVLVAASIVIAASTIVVGIITTTFRTSNKTSSQEEVRKNGNYVISQFTKQVQFADVFVGVSENGLEPYNSACDSLTDYYYIKVKSDSVTSTFACFDSSNTLGIYLSNDSVIDINDSLIDTNSVIVKEPDVETTCKITCSLGTTSSSPVVGLDFSLTLADDAKSGVPEGNVNIDFSTSVKMRNF